MVERQVKKVIDVQRYDTLGQIINFSKEKKGGK